MARNRVIYQSEALYVGPSPAVSGFFTNKTEQNRLSNNAYSRGL